MGYDIKVNQKEIKITPGPGDYEILKTQGISSKTSHNYAMATGGIKKSFLSHKEELVVRALGGKPPRCKSKASSKRESNYLTAHRAGKIPKLVGVITNI